MFLPYESTLSLWFSSSPIYQWEPVPVPPPPADAAACNGSEIPIDGASGIGVEAPRSSLPAMRLVFKGMKWSTYPVFGMRENLAWQATSDTRRDEDQQRCADNLREAHKGPKPAAGK